MEQHCQKEEVINIIKDDLKEIKKDIKTLLSSVAMLTVKSSVWGIAGGAIVLLIYILKKVI